MVYTLTLNPSLDYVVEADKLALGTVNRCKSQIFQAGGKGINVSVMLTNLGVENVALGFVAGFTGDEFVRILSQHECKTDFIKLENGFTRINPKVKCGEVGAITEINCQSPKISEAELGQLYAKLDVLGKDDFLVLGGSVPDSLPQNFYELLMKRLDGKGIRFVVDTTGDTLLTALKHKPFLVKPNHLELGEIFNSDIDNGYDAMNYGKKLSEMGAQNTIVSMGENGAVLINAKGECSALMAPHCEVVNTVGAGDSMVAGFIAGYLQTGDTKKAFHTAVAAGTATVSSNWIGTSEKVSELLEQLNKKEY